MKDRIFQIMKRENMSQQEFANALDVSPASLSNIFNGRTNPTNNHVSAIHRRFPDINVNWLMFGEGKMYEADPERGKQAAESTLFSEEQITYSTNGNQTQVELNGNEHANVPLPASKDLPDNESSYKDMQIPVIRETIKYIDKPQRRITEIRIFFDDGTYEVFSGNR